ncbi:2,4-dihydroxyhept-2-ene-1,7-dioic acid aldolase [Acidisoma cellulosilytica]|uniref:2,4-dihydroxyhept-2-ene-1,7-dioic acid aldolase n=1 Tax=Acidisoma cellulosilyticum TaxID=2802395 RepID=A0A963Z598_9PROT|nr:aldolase/citrate lyase family protein [Acidisoma cellulosilyticum]MCB8882072.1 2,4-dihydroxyhept-2-ene-1,7-dioic acid aldolase [Acidisoma cellulosilyticum]
MRANNLRKIWSEGGTVYNGWLMIPSSVSAEMMARQGWDSITVDMQHGLIDYADALTMLQAISVTDSVPVVRVPSLESGIIGKMLDAGAYAIICPMVNTREQAEYFVRSCRYAPLGHRSMGPVRATMYGGSDYGLKANETVVSMAMIETGEAVDNIDEILSVPGLDSIFVGPSDLSVSLGHTPGFDPRFPKVYDAIVKIAEAAKRHNIPAGIHTGSIAYTRDMEALGYSFFAYLSELRFMAGAGNDALSELRQGGEVAGATKSSSY